MTKSIVDEQYIQGQGLLRYLLKQQELTLWAKAGEYLKKDILLSAASYFETEISEIIIKTAEIHSSKNQLIVSIIKQKAVSRQYHTYFNWDSAKNANSFFSLFGDDFKVMMQREIATNKSLEESIRAFLQLGQERNKLVHQNYAAITIDKTVKEIYRLYRKSLLFINIIQENYMHIKKIIVVNNIFSNNSSPTP